MHGVAPMTTLVPTVHERLARCGTSVFVDGLVTGAEVVLDVGGVELTHPATGPAHVFAVPSMAAGDVVRARQDAGAGFTPWSPGIVVEDALVPPQAVPGVPEDIGACSECVLVSNVVPGCEVEIRLGSGVIGSGTANRHGWVCVGVDLQELRGRPNGPIDARMVVCGASGPDATMPIIAEPLLPRPSVGGPLYGCQRIVPLANLHRGAEVDMETNTGTNLGGICSCWTAVNVITGHELVVGELVRARQSWRTDPCKQDGPWGDWRPVVAPDEGIKPEVLEALVEGDQTIRVDNQKLGATLLVRIRPTEGAAADEFGPRSASIEQEVDLNGPLTAGNVVTVVQTLCGVSFESDPVTVLPLPPVILAPVVIPPLYACGAAVQVSNLHPGAFVRIYEDGIPIGGRWAGEASSISVGAAPSLFGGGMVTAKQTVGGKESPESAPPIPVLDLKEIQPPRILAPVANGDTEVVVSRVTPGARVSIRSGAAIIGEVDAAETIVHVSTSSVPGPVNATARLCGQSSTGPTIRPITSPCAAGDFASSAEEFRSYASFAVPATDDGDPVTTRIEGQLYFPADDQGDFDPAATNLPLVVIAHGYWRPGADSYLGYDYLAHHLARWGMVVFSVNMDDVNNVTARSRTHQYTRGETVLHVVDELFADATLAGRIDSSRVALIGHSMGGEGVVAAQVLNLAGSRGYGIQGIVSIAPTHYRPELVLRDTRYLQLFGSRDLLMARSVVTGPDSQAHFSGFRIYDRAWRPKSHAWIYRARHNPFNRSWILDGDTYESGITDALPAQDHEAIAICLINAFVQDALFGRGSYAGYLQGTILPPSLRSLEIYMQHGREPRVVVDNFGDVDEQEALLAQPLDQASNSRSQAANATGAGLTVWNDVDHTTLANSPHNTKGTEVAWTDPNVMYTSATGGLAATSTDVIALRIGQFFEDAALNPVAAPADLFVTLSDGADEATVRLGSAGLVPHPAASLNVIAPMRTVRLPIDAFRAANPDLSLSTIQSVTLWLAGRATGHILVDDLELGG